jgi:hypothetical protein
MNQKTLEEAAENYTKNETDSTLKLISKYSFKDGAKYGYQLAQERMYNEEDLQEAFYAHKQSWIDYEGWFENFKKIRHERRAKSNM